MTIDLSVELIHATVQLEQSQGNGTRTVGTGFLINAPGPDGAPRTVLVTASHVLDKMPGAEMRIGYRFQTEAGDWKYKPQAVTIREGDRQLWTRNPKRDVSALVVKAPAEFARAAIPLDWLADGQAFDRFGVGPGYEMMALGYPRGLSANGAGFPILRSGKVASYPLAPSAAFPTFLLDFSVFPGNSGGPVFVRAQALDGTPALMIAGMLTQQVELNQERLEIGVVTQASFVRETIALLDGQAAPAPVPLAPPGPTPIAEAFSAMHQAAQATQ